MERKIILWYIDMTADELKCEFCRNVFDLPELRNRTGIFRDRTYAGFKLSKMLVEFRDSDALVCGIPAGGVPVAAPIAKELNLDLDVVVVSKLTLPWNTEVGYGAVAFDGTLKINPVLKSQMGLNSGEIEKDVALTTKKVQRRFKEFRGDKTFPNLENRRVILADDGIASGFTMMVAIESVKNKGAKEVMVAVPTAPLQALEKISSEVDRIYCANIRGGPAFAVADAYQTWYDVEEKDVITILKDFNLKD